MPTELQMIAPISVLWTRLKWHATTGNGSNALLQGLRVYDEPEWHVEGQDHLPNICPIDYTDGEAIFAGAKRAPAGSGTPTEDHSSIMLSTTVFTFMLAVRKKHGMFGSGGSIGFLRWITLIRDALDMDEEGHLDVLFKNTCIKPFTTAIQDNVVSSDSWAAGISVTLYPREVIRGTRRDAMEV